MTAGKDRHRFSSTEDRPEVIRCLWPAAGWNVLRAGRMEMKTCSKCGETKPTTEFNKDSRRISGLRARCKSCASIERASNPEKGRANAARWLAANKQRKRATDAAWRAANREKVKARVDAWYAANRDRVNATQASQYAANPEKKKAANAAWRAANPEKQKAAAAAWDKANPEARRIAGHNRRARRRANGGKLSKGLAEKLFKLQRGKCACGCKQPLGTDYHLDHRMPLALGGANEDWNIQLLRSTCNQQKSAKHPVDFMQQRGLLL